METTMNLMPTGQDRPSKFKRPSGLNSSRFWQYGGLNRLAGMAPPSHPSASNLSMLQSSKPTWLKSVSTVEPVGARQHRCPPLPTSGFQGAAWNDSPLGRFPLPHLLNACTLMGLAEAVEGTAKPRRMRFAVE
jgi:hypothetical protein